MATRVARSSRSALVIGSVVVMVLLGTAWPALADECSAVGTFTFTIAGGTGRLFLSADGTVEMILQLGHNICPVCASAGRVLRGTYRTVADQGCAFEITLSNPPPAANTDTMGGVVASEGRVLLFLRATSPDFESGLAIRNDALTGR